MRQITLLLFSLPFAIAAQIPEHPAPTFQPGALPLSWQVSGPTCPDNRDWQIHPYNADFYILREPGCTNYEKPFLYLIFGKSRALLIDTGAGPAETKKAVDRARQQWSNAHAGQELPLVVAHSHGHGDHIAGDAQFQNQNGVEFITATPEAAQRAFQIKKWPDEPGSIDLGSLMVTVIAIPGHQVAALAFYDAQTGILLTGDSLYPGRLFVNDAWQEFRESTRRLVQFTAVHPVTHILGCHIEQTRQPYHDYPVKTIYQPDEHALEMGRAHLLELDQALTDLGDQPTRQAFRDFTIWPVQKRLSRPNSN